jgi:hypothetical protein
MGRLPLATVLFAEKSTIPNCYGITLFDRDFVRPVIFLNSETTRWGKTLVHECLHVAEPALPHGVIFDMLVESYWRRARKELRGLK